MPRYTRFSVVEECEEAKRIQKHAKVSLLNTCMESLPHKKNEYNTYYLASYASSSVIKSYSKTYRM